ncbi:ArsR/SmtB family transcription factor [Phaeobacter gallaeciensis]|uniref:Transcriptional regulator, ArsR family n=1 Tax=Phaeobacter gallaeciensis TaxID=60890 RepID=A0AAD0EBU1_9RHOB|nr:metalloregulator ArsR/SmtB family transcription factor [Phaeobacter gallaeciensis]AHD08341.1 transcriptional regulator, ArsR family [Phaeobacter gallaeciensis DSM 26640]ATE91607.1 transcriptional regulator, ArsR family [Phaeobacter gallaeciensis]ATE95883.1 transcriptional regulator, ArsR family [Phaeobacter gallaeciensis]ATF00223.1 transcriptional regulator, ArsR family [Phaeobacter gallaeciensis]ATF04655.1 transcriptional regulator, ArsR family [Phaeobacter gallaeciensis]
MEWEQAAGGFAAMGSEARLAVLRCLVRAGDGGLMVQDIRDRTGIAPSTLAHHLKLLAGAGLILQRKDGRSTYNTADYDQLKQLAGFILSECCADDVPIREVANDG